jgi:Flp pilus assembly protein TadG
MIPMRNRSRRGVALVEFTLAGIALIFLTICTFHLALAMWNYHTLARAIHETTRFMAVKGVNCVKPGNSCSANVGTIATKIQTLGIGLQTANLNVTLTTDSGAQTSCSPLSNCLTSTTVWPPGSHTDNAVGKKITISAMYQYNSPMLFFWPGAGDAQRFGTIWLPASSTQVIVF